MQYPITNANAEAVKYAPPSDQADQREARHPKKAPPSDQADQREARHHNCPSGQRDTKKKEIVRFGTCNFLFGGVDCSRVHSSPLEVKIKEWI